MRKFKNLIIDNAITRLMYASGSWTVFKYSDGREDYTVDKQTTGYREPWIRKGDLFSTMFCYDLNITETEAKELIEDFGSTDAISKVTEYLNKNKPFVKFDDISFYKICNILVNIIGDEIFNDLPDVPITNRSDFKGDNIGLCEWSHYDYKDEGFTESSIRQIIKNLNESR